MQSTDYTIVMLYQFVISKLAIIIQQNHCFDCNTLLAMTKITAYD